MNQESKGRSPFYPGQPVPAEFFSGRVEQIDYILKRGANQVCNGKPATMFVEGDYGIGKSSLAGIVQRAAERDYGLYTIYVSLGGVHETSGIGFKVLKGTIESGAFDPKRSEKIKNWLSKYIGKQVLFGLTLHADQLKKDGPSVSSGLLPFLDETYAHLDGTGTKGIFLVLDEINGIANDLQFSTLIKEIVDTNALRPTPLPLLLMLCGVGDRRAEMINRHQSIGRVFDVVNIKSMADNEAQDFYTRAFESVDIAVEPDAMKLLVQYATGLPNIMHLIGDAAFWDSDDSVITKGKAYKAIISAAETLGKKFVDQKIINALRSDDYKAILKTIGSEGPLEKFKKSDFSGKLTDGQKKKFNNFLQRMKKLKALRSGDAAGEYEITNSMVGVYIWLESTKED